MAKRKKIKKYQPGGYYNPYDELTMSSDSFSGVNNADAEIEGGELILTQQGAPQLDNMSMLKFLGPNAFEVKGKSHAQGGIFAKFSEGENIVISREYAKEMKKVLADKEKASAMLNSGDAIDQNQAKIDLAQIEARQNNIINTQQNNNGNKTNVTMARYGMKKYDNGGKDISMPSDNTKVASPLLDPMFMQYMLDQQAGMEAPFDADKILNPSSGTYLYQTKDQGSGQTQPAKDHEFFLDAYRSEIDRLEKNFSETPMKNADYIENVAPSSAGGTKKERDSSRYFNNFLNSYMMTGMDTINESVPNQRYGGRNMKYNKGGRIMKAQDGVVHTNPPFMSAMNSSFTGPAEEPIERINALKSEIARLEESFNSSQRVQTARGYSSFTGTMRDISRDAIKAQEELKRLTGKNYAQGGRYMPNMKKGGRVMGGQPPKYFLGGIGSAIGGAIKGMGGLGGILGAVAPYASGIYNTLAPMFAGEPDTYNPQDFMTTPSQVTDRVDPISQSAKMTNVAQMDPYAQTAPMMQLSATAMNNYSGPNAASYRQALMSDMQGKVGSQFAQVDYMNQMAKDRMQQFNFGVDQANVGVDMANADISKYNAGLSTQANMQNQQMDWNVNQYNDQLLAAGPAQTATGIGQLSNAFMGQQYNQTLQGLSDTMNYSMGQGRPNPSTWKFDPMTGQSV